MAKKIKVTRKQIKSDDEFLSWLKQLSLRFYEHRKVVGLGIAGFFGVVVIIFGVRYFMQSGKSQSVGAMAQAEKVFYAPVASGEDNESAEFDSEQERYEAALEKFTEVSRKYERTKQGQLAHFYTALSYQHLLKNEEAAVEYRKFLKNADSSNPLWSIAWQALGYCEEAVKNYDEALAAFKKMQENDKDPYLKRQSYLHMARVQEIQKDFSAAQENLEAYLSETGDADPNKRQIERQISILKKLQELNAS